MNIDKTARRLNVSGAIGVIPTDTVYGVVARAHDQEAVTRLYELKRREHKPGTLIAASVDQLVVLGFKRRYLQAVEKYWPSPVSVIVPCMELAYLHQGVGSLAVRIPNKPELLQLLQITGPLLTSSANQPGEPPANTLAEAKAYFDNGVDFYEDGGNLSNARPSTVIRVVDDAIEVLRQGTVEINEITGEVIP